MLAQKPEANSEVASGTVVHLLVGHHPLESPTTAESPATAESPTTAESPATVESPALG